MTAARFVKEVDGIDITARFIHLSTHNMDWEDGLVEFCRAGFEPLRSGTSCDDGVWAPQHVLLLNARRAA